MAFPSFFAGLLGLAVAGLSILPAFGQESDAVESTLVEQHGMWVFECSAYGQEKVEYCTMQQVVSVEETGQLVLAMTIAHNPRTGEPVLIAMTPLGVDLQSGMGLKVDDGPQLGAPFTTCQQIGCRAAAPLSETLLASLKAGNQITISYSLRGQRVDAPVSLTGFTGAYTALEAKRRVVPPADTAQPPAPAPAQ